MDMALDHVTIGARSLDEGAAYIREVLGVDIPAGGKHPDMGTHNRLMRVGDGVFLELLAIDGDAPRPPRPRWFAMDDPGRAERLAQQPHPVGWVVSTGNLDRVQAECPVDLGRSLPMSRGSRTWRLTVPDDGWMPFGGLVPAVIQWSEGPHPSGGMTFVGPTLDRIILRHPEANRLRDVLERLGVAHLASIEQDDKGPSMAFVFKLPDGDYRTLV